MHPIGPPPVSVEPREHAMMRTLAMIERLLPQAGEEFRRRLESIRGYVLEQLDVHRKGAKQ